MPKTINVFINGTDERTHDLDNHNGITSLANVLHALAETREDITNICIDGCSINNPYPMDFGAIFTFNLEKQVNEIARQVREEVMENQQVHLNLYGFSRGGAAVFWLCKKLKDIPGDRLTINASAFEPVPGNFMRGVYVDKISGANTTLASQISDLRDCKNVARIQVLFTCDPLPDIACHGPVLPVLPKKCEIDVDVTAGCHKGSEIFSIFDKNVIPFNAKSAISFHQIVDFLESGGMQFDFSKLELCPSLKDRSTENKTQLLQAIRIKPTKRSMHFGNEITAKKGSAEYLNLYHQKLEKQPEDPRQCQLVLKNYSPVPTYYNCQKSLGFFSTAATIGVVSLLSYGAYTSLSNSVNYTP